MKINRGYIRTYREEEVDAIAPPAGGDLGDPETPAVPPVDDGNDTVPELSPWDELNKDFDTEDSDEDEFGLDVPEEAETPPVVPEETPPVETPAEPQPADVIPEIPVVPETPPEEQPIEPEVQPEAPQAPQPLTSEQQEASRKVMVEGLEKHFQLSEQESLQMVTDPGKALPKVLAKHMAAMYESIIDTVKKSLPAAIEYNVQNTKARSAKADEFFTAWPKLDRVKHGRDIATISTMYGKLNPNATEAEVIQNVGLQVMMHHGIVPDQLQQNVDNPVATPSPRKPSSVHGASAPMQSQNEWTTMADELLDDD